MSLISCDPAGFLDTSYPPHYLQSIARPAYGHSLLADFPHPAVSLNQSALHMIPTTHSHISTQTPIKGMLMRNPQPTAQVSCLSQQAHLASR